MLKRVQFYTMYLVRKKDVINWEQNGNFYISSNGLKIIQHIPTNRGGRTANEIRD